MTDSSFSSSSLSTSSSPAPDLFDLDHRRHGRHWEATVPTHYRPQHVINILLLNNIIVTTNTTITSSVWDCTNDEGNTREDRSQTMIGAYVVIIIVIIVIIIITTTIIIILPVWDYRQREETRMKWSQIVVVTHIIIIIITVITSRVWDYM